MAAFRAARDELVRRIRHLLKEEVGVASGEAATDRGL